MYDVQTMLLVFFMKYLHLLTVVSDDIFKVQDLILEEDAPESKVDRNSSEGDGGGCVLPI